MTMRFLSVNRIPEILIILTEYSAIRTEVFMTKTEYIFRYNISRLRKEHGYTYQNIADYMGTDVGDIIKQHKTNYPHQPRHCFDRMEAYAELYDIKPYELLVPPEDISYPDDLITDSYYIDPDSKLRKRQLAERRRIAQLNSWPFVPWKRRTEPRQ